jgi:hypothetical protein
MTSAMLTDRIVQAVAALRAGGHRVEEVRGAANVYRIDGGDAVTGSVVLALAIRLGLLDGPTGG